MFKVKGLSAAAVAVLLGLGSTAAIAQTTNQEANVLTEKVETKTWRPSCNGSTCSGSGIGL